MAAVLACVSGVAIAQVVVPPGVTPGGAQPQGLPGSRAVLPDPNTPVFRIPPVFERPLGVDEGERVFVRGFVLTGVVDDAGAGIDAAEVEARVQQRFSDLQKLLESLRVEKQQQTDVDSDGFSPEERQRILSFIRDVVTNLDADAQVAAYQQFVDELRLQRQVRDQGLTIGQIGQVAEAVTAYYRERGYILARAIVPAQEVVDGIVTIQVLEGRLAKVSAENNKRFDSAAIEAPFKSSVGKLVTVERMENALLTLSNYPGMLASGVFRPGPGVGTTEMVLNVQREKPWALQVRADNHGSRFTGEHRLLADFNWNAPTGNGDVLNVTALQSYKPDAALFGSMRYEAPFVDPTYRWGFEASRNTFDAFDPVTGDSLAVGGISQVGKLYMQRYFKRSRAASNYMKLDLTRKSSDTETAGAITAKDDLAILGLEFGGDEIDSASNTISTRFFRIDRGMDSVMGVPNEGDARVTGYFPGYSRSPPSIRFIKYSFNYTQLKALQGDKTLLMRLSGNYSQDYLISTEQFNFGGANNVRGAPVSAALRDKGFFGSLEYSMRAPGFGDKKAWWGEQTWSRVLGISLFTDHAVGWNNETPTEKAFPDEFSRDRLYLGSHGVSFDMVLPWGITWKTQYAHLNGGPKVPNDPAGIKDANQIWMEFSRSF